jgi:HK97 gp10 family phage protein
VVVETDVEYAIYQEMGTRYQSGTPFLKPSGESNIDTFKTVIENELKK